MVVYVLVENGGGWGLDAKVLCKAVTHVIYIDTPAGQSSFHVVPGKYDAPAYEREWSGKHDTPDIVARLF